MTSGESAHDNTPTEKATAERDAAHDSPIVRTGDVVQTEPAMDMNDTSTAEKIDGIVVQTRADQAVVGQDRMFEILKQRLDQAGIEMSDDEIAKLAED
ncbi:MAG: hypothetical protein Q7T17_10115 [Microbacterium sp.]|uniref:hypothetical protein n=1 Tax=Microbacterium sp. TaxID=51671 RepID=UPI0027194718|nr:hypothetical protein [Microbacterium sp.]MDO8383319.1 hypothetical protein [Microbacterium sp.]